MFCHATDVSRLPPANGRGQLGVSTDPSAPFQTYPSNPTMSLPDGCAHGLFQYLSLTHPFSYPSLYLHTGAVCKGVNDKDGCQYVFYIKHTGNILITYNFKPLPINDENVICMFLCFFFKKKSIFIKKVAKLQLSLKKRLFFEIFKK